jgi:saccharopine dehydrogenase-like NADP-dependent oxidoreductase
MEGRTLTELQQRIDGQTSNERSTIESVLTVGAGRIGSLVAQTLKARDFETGLADVRNLPGAGVAQVDVNDPAALARLVGEYDAVVACLPYDLNARVAEAAHASGRHYFDPTEDVATTRTVVELSKTARAAMVPQCGIAPGFVNIVAASLADKFDRVDSLQLRAGELPASPTTALGYAFTWSPDGVVNEYLEPCEVLSGGRTSFVPPLGDLERLIIEGTELEAFSTSGGTGTLCDSLAGRVNSLNYKTIRYPGHRDLMHFFLRELGLEGDRERARDILARAYPPVSDDVLYFMVSATGEGEHGRSREEFVRAYRPRDFFGQTETAIRWATVAGICGVVELLAGGKLPQKGLIRQEDIRFEDFVHTSAGSYLA